MPNPYYLEYVFAYTAIRLSGFLAAEKCFWSVGKKTDSNRPDSRFNALCGYAMAAVLIYPFWSPLGSAQSKVDKITVKRESGCGLCGVGFLTSQVFWNYL